MSITVAHPGDAPAVAEPPRRSSLPKRVVDLFFSPGELFEELRDRPSSADWVGPVVLSVAVLAAIYLLRPLFFTDREMAEAVLEMMRQQRPNATLPSAEQFAAQYAVMQWVYLGGGAFWFLLRPFLVGGVLSLLFGVVLGGNAPYLRHVSVASWAFLVSTLGAAVIAALQYASGRTGILLDATLLAPGVKGGVASALLHTLSPWLLWLVALLGLGGATVNRRFGWLGPAALLLGLTLALSAAFGFLGSLFAGGGA